MKEKFDAFLKEMPIVAILRGISQKEIIPVCDALYDAGIKLLEIPLNTPDAFSRIREAAEYCGTRQMVGAGTVLTKEDVQNVKASGGKFIISPNTDEEVIRESKALSLVSIPGFFTATEGFKAVKAGADYLKLFPACLGPSYIKDLKAVIKTPIMAVGGVTTENFASFLDVACGAGIGGTIYKPGKPLSETKAAAEKLVSIVNEWRN
ncbi:MAG: 2-dehydro-3-deoxy-6-phosphogalactonate aldolase [Lentisphaeria bacterium]|nr:2-dehydro-3-deoxy-6-phosphogalactonate aldolase [Lentisphaeria bacterium]